VTDRELRAELARALGGPVTALRRRPLAYRSSYAIEELDVRLGDGSSRRLLLKDVSRAALAPEAAGAKPGFLLDPRREIAVYRDILGPLEVGTPALLASVADPGTDTFWLVLERVAGELLWQADGWDAWEATARWLAELHLRRVPASSVLLRYDETWLRTWLARAIAFAPPGSLHRLARGFDAVVSRLAAWPASLLHGELYPSNVLVERGGVRVIDWEMAGVGPGVLDLAALTAGGWSADERARLVRAYHRTWTAGGGRASEAELLETLEHARLAVALQWLGWSGDWTPPPEHAHDWLTDALVAAERVGL
jgi:hypothetical protein